MTSRCWLDIQPVPRFVFIVTIKVIVPRFDQIDNHFVNKKPRVVLRGFEGEHNFCLAIGHGVMRLRVATARVIDVDRCRDRLI